MAVDNFNEICAAYKGMLGFSSDHLVGVNAVDVRSCVTLAALRWGGTDPGLQSRVSSLFISQLSIRLFFLYLKSQKGFRSSFTSFIYVGNTMYSTPLPRIAPYPLPKFCLSRKTQVKSHSLWKVFPPPSGWQPLGASGTHTARHIHLVSGTWCFGWWTFCWECLLYKPLELFLSNVLAVSKECCYWKECHPLLGVIWDYTLHKHPGIFHSSLSFSFSDFFFWRSNWIHSS